ncbi:MAG: hypothetical protein ACU84H_02055 [Gammaproteobacteria bacterium]
MVEALSIFCFDQHESFKTDAKYTASHNLNGTINFLGNLREMKKTKNISIYTETSEKEKRIVYFVSDYLLFGALKNQSIIDKIVEAFLSTMNCETA